MWFLSEFLTTHVKYIVGHTRVLDNWSLFLESRFELMRFFDLTVPGDNKVKMGNLIKNLKNVYARRLSHLNKLPFFKNVLLLQGRM